MSETSNQDSQNRLDKVHGELSRYRKKVSTSTNVTIIVGIIILCLLSCYFAFGYSMFKDVLEPEQLVAAVTDVVENQVPVYRKSLQDQIDENASEWAEQLSTQALDYLPELRGQVEDYALEQTRGMVDSLSVMTEDQFRKVVRDNRDVLRISFKELGRNDELSTETLGQLEKALEDQLGTNMREQAAMLLESLAMIDQHLKKLKDGKDLNKEEQVMREGLSIARRLQIEQADPDFKGKPAPKATRAAVPPAAVEKPTDQGSGTKTTGDSAKPAPAKTKPAPAKTKPAPAKTKPAPAKTKPAPAKTKPAPAKTKPATAKEKPDAKKPAGAAKE